MKIPIDQIICRDCLKVTKSWPDNCVDLVLTDPPYGCTKLEWDRYPTQEELTECLRISRGVVCWFGAAPPHCEAAIHKLTPLFERKYIWHNTFTLTHSEDAFWQWQPIYVWNRKELRGLKRDVISMAANYGSSGIGRHPTQKPILLMENLIQAGSNCNDLVLDPFCGSGTTCVAAKMLGRRYIGIDISEKYCEIARKRLKGVRPNLFEKSKNKKKKVRTSFGISIKKIRRKK